MCKYKTNIYVKKIMLNLSIETNYQKIFDNLKYKFLLKISIILCLSFLFFALISTKYKNVFETEKGIKIFNINQFFTTKIKRNSILIFEKNNFHYECTPGFVKYFLDLGYNVDLITTKIGNESFIFFEATKKIRFFKLDDSNKYYEIEKYVIKFREIFKKYVAILLQTMFPDLNYFYTNANLLKGKNSICVYHYYPEMRLIDFHNNKRSWTLLNFTNRALEVNPHYFGKINLTDKNKITRFFIVSTNNRNYDKLIYASDKLKNEDFQFEIIVTGRCKSLNVEKIPTNIKDKFFFKLNLSYLDLMKIIQTIDFILITLDKNNPGDITYNEGRSTGSSQLSYGFLKPVLINKDFSKTYRMNSENSIIYNELKDSLYFAMRTAIMMTNDQYKKKQYNLKKTVDKIYQISMNNVKTTLDYILKSDN